MFKDLAELLHLPGEGTIRKTEAVTLPPTHPTLVFENPTDAGSAASPGSVGFRPARERCEWPPHAAASGRPPFGLRLLRPEDSPAFFAEFDQRDHPGLHTLGIFDQRRLLALGAGHRLERVLAGQERNVGHALLE